jgi:hypothetical protein
MMQKLLKRTGDYNTAGYISSSHLEIQQLFCPFLCRLRHRQFGSSFDYCQ